MIQSNITPIVIVLGAVLVVAVALIVYLFWRTRRLEADCELLVRDTQGQNFVEIVGDNISQVEHLLYEVEKLSEQYAQVLRRMAGAVQHIGVVRFDAFRDLGGLLSFAVALLDDRGNGLVLSSIYGRNESRTYSKPVVERGSSYELSPEEKEAIRLAMQSKELGALPVEARDREHEERMANLRLFHDREYAQRTGGPQGRTENAHAQSGSERAQSARRAQPREDEYAEERYEERATEETPEPQPRPRPAPRETHQRRGPGRVKHVGPPPDGRQERRREPEPEQEPPERTGPPIDLVSELMDETPPDRRADKTPEKQVPRRPAAPRPRGLDTPVERLRNREPRGE
ncbi:MAG TPA: DUF4446 family protein [Candidatus Anoxymicrobiaceae bacterium]